MAHDIIVIGTSYGGISALKRLVRRLPGDLPASIFIALHLPGGSETHLPETLMRHGHLPAAVPDNGDGFEPGHIYVAKPNHHLLVKADRVSLTLGPRVGRFRPSINVLFWSAAAFHTTRVIGILLTGYMDDGVNGLSAIQRCGGITVVQDPKEAEVPDLPAAAIRNMKVDHILRLEGIAEAIPALLALPAAEPMTVPEDIMEELRVSEHAVPDLENTSKLGQLTPYTCPECGGVLWEIPNESPPRFRCHTGHSFTRAAYLDGQAEVIENSLWSVLRHIQERIDILNKIADGYLDKGKDSTAESYKEKARQMSRHVRNIREFIMSGGLAALPKQESREDRRP